MQLSELQEAAKHALDNGVRIELTVVGFRLTVGGYSKIVSYEEVFFGKINILIATIDLMLARLAEESVIAKET